MRTSIEDKRKARTVAQDTLQDMTQLVSLKKQLDSQQGHVAVSIKNQDAENSKLEQQLIDIQLKVKQEELIKELNTLKSGKKSDAILTTAMKDQEKAVAKLIADGGAEEGKLDQQVEELLR
jgi:biotin synthase-related radical SAM superfamily protein